MRKRRIISLPAIDRVVSLRAYANAIKRAKAEPETVFRHGLTTWWPTKGADILRQFLAGLHDRINDGVPCTERGDVAS